MQGGDATLAGRAERPLHVARLGDRALDQLSNGDLRGGFPQGRSAVGDEGIEVEHDRPPCLGANRLNPAGGHATRTDRRESTALFQLQSMPDRYDGSWTSGTSATSWPLPTLAGSRRRRRGSA